MKKKDDESKVWITAIKLILGAVVLIGGTGLALWYVDRMQERQKPSIGSAAGQTGWGIAGDNPLKNRR